MRTCSNDSNNRHLRHPRDKCHSIFQHTHFTSVLPAEYTGLWCVYLHIIAWIYLLETLDHRRPEFVSGYGLTILSEQEAKNLHVLRVLLGCNHPELPPPLRSSLGSYIYLPTHESISAIATVRHPILSKKYLLRHQHHGYANFHCTSYIVLSNTGIWLHRRSAPARCELYGRISGRDPLRAGRPVDRIVHD